MLDVTLLPGTRLRGRCGRKCIVPLASLEALWNAGLCVRP